MKVFQADRIYPIHTRHIDQGIVVFNQQDEVEYVGPYDKMFVSADIQKIDGWLVPGFVNAHCHLELSHLRAIVPTGLGLIPFIKDVVSKRDFPLEVIMDSIDKGNQEMYDNGIVAVGDISNLPHTNKTKNSSPILYHTFVELFDFWQSENAANTFQEGLKVIQSFNCKPHDKKSLSPHSPYSVSDTLMKLILNSNMHSLDASMSIHNQETPAENELYNSNTGDFLKFYDDFKLSLNEFTSPNDSAIHFTLKYAQKLPRLLMIHNTLSTSKDMDRLESAHDKVHWVTCPNANLYIENALPNYQDWIAKERNIAIGTDSLTSNWQLSILEELKTIYKFNNYIYIDELLKWATKGGAQALGYDSFLGTLEIGKRPGLNQLYFPKGLETFENAQVQRLI